MSDSLDALYRAAIASPSDRTIRLVTADALEETGDAARAEFIRLQIERESHVEVDTRHAAIQTRCSELFEQHWLAWWRPVAEAAGLPYPHEPGKRVRDRITRAVRRQRRHANWPYTHTTADTEVHLVEYGMTFRFAGGFPEEVRFLNLDAPEGGPVLLHRWGEAMPLTRLAFASYVSRAEWDRIHGPHLAHLATLVFDRLLPDVATDVATSPHLTELNLLAANPLGSDPGAIAALVSSPPWADLRALRLTGRTSPDGIRALAHSCNLAHLEELDVTLAISPNAFAISPGLPSDLWRMFARAVSIPTTESPRWVEFGPALESLAAAEWVSRLRVLRIASGHHPSGLLGMIGERLYGSTESASDVIPDAAVLALAAAATTDKLERLVLPGALVGPSVREDLTTRLAGRVAFV